MQGNAVFHHEAKELLNIVKYDKSTTYMDPKEEIFWLHFLSRDRLIGDYIRSQIRKNPYLRKEILGQPVCEKCEGFAFFHKGGYQCANCGHWSPEKTTVKQYLKEGLHHG